MSRTVIDIIKRAYRLIGVYSIGEAPTSDESSDGLEALNAMLDGWATEPLLTHVKTLDSITLIPNTSVYTIGASGTTIATRPLEIDDSSYLEWLGVSYPLAVATMDEYNAIVSKGAKSDVPYVLWYKDDFPNGTVTLWPTPTTAMTLKLWSIKPLTAFVNLTDVVALPPGYENAITFNLAIALAAEFAQPVPNTVMKEAALSKKKIKRSNYQTIKLEISSSIPARGFNAL